MPKKKNLPLIISYSNCSKQDKETILKEVTVKKNLTRRGRAVRITTDFSSETMQARREWTEIHQELIQL
jgi:hypothetical protein